MEALLLCGSPAAATLYYQPTAATGKLHKPAPVWKRPTLQGPDSSLLAALPMGWHFLTTDFYRFDTDFTILASTKNSWDLVKTRVRLVCRRSLASFTVLQFSEFLEKIQSLISLWSRLNLNTFSPEVCFMTDL